MKRRKKLTLIKTQMC